MTTKTMSTEDRVGFLEGEMDRIIFELSRTLNIDLSGKTPDANIPPQPERRITDLGRPQLAYDSTAASYETQGGPDSLGAAKDLPPVEQGVHPGTSEPIVDSGGGQGTGPLVVVEQEPASGGAEATDAAQKKADELGVTIAEVKGTGADGRVTVADVEGHASKQG